MRPGLTGKRSYPGLDSVPIPIPGGTGRPGGLYVAGQQHNASDPSVLKARHAGARVWSDLRGAIRAIGRSSRNSKYLVRSSWAVVIDST
jgi:hypothetical protein